MRRVIERAELVPFTSGPLALKRNADMRQQCLLTRELRK
jgi:hypothetical protein